MFNDKIFDEWLDKKAYQIIEALGEGKALSSEEMMILVLKAQTNHFNHLDVDLREEMKLIREDMNSESKKLREDMNNENRKLREDMQSESKKLREDINNDMKALREDMNKRFEQVDKRFEQVDKRFEQVDKRFDAITTRMDRFMIWSFATTVSVGGIVIAALKFL